MENQETTNIMAKFSVQKYNDVSLDNGLVTFSRILKKLNEDDDDVIEKVDIYSGPLKWDNMLR